MVGPAQAQRVLSSLLHASGSVSALPVVSLRLEEQVASPVHAEFFDRRVDQRVCVRETLKIIRELALAAAEVEATRRRAAALIRALEP